MENKVVEVEDLKVYYERGGGLLSKPMYIKAVDGVSFSISRGEVLGLVGESGSGKTSVGKAIAGIVRPTSGKISVLGRDIINLSRGEARRLRPKIQMIFQNPFSSLDPRMRVRDIIVEPLKIAGIKDIDFRVKAAELLEMVGLSEEHLDRFPHQFSGGQRQRIAIARALSTNPELIIADEPTSALDVSIQAQILNLLKELRDKLDLTMLFISHDIGVIRYIADRVAVMYAGKIVELGNKRDVIDEPLHPYTESLLEAVPVPHPSKRRKETIIPGEPPDPINPPSGCRFHPRCPHALDICRTVEPKLIYMDNSRMVACHLYQD